MIHILGAMIANKKYDEHGNIIDGGNLEIKTLELYMQNMMSHDKGHLLGLGFAGSLPSDAKYQSSGKPVFGNKYDFAFGLKDQEKESKATIGQGKVEAARVSGDLNRDIYNVEQKSGYDLGQTRGSYQQADWSSIFSTVGEAFSNPSSVYERTTNRMQDALDNGKDLFAKLAGTAEPEITAWDVIDLKESTTTDDTDPTNNLEKLFEGIVDDYIYVEDLPSLDSDETKVTETSQQEQSVKKLAQKLVVMKEHYDDFAEEYPKLAEHGLSALSVSFQTLIGFAAGPVGAAAGFINGVRGELAGEAINYIAGEQIARVIEAGIELGAKELQSKYPSLTESEARHLAGGALLATTATAEGSTGIKQVIRHLDTVEKVGKFYPRNAKFAGKIFQMEDATEKMKISYPNLSQKYPNGVEFDINGYPVFEPYVIKKVEVPNLIGDHYEDFKKANDAAGYKSTPKGYTWHHHQDTMTMELIPKDLHRVVAHTGGAALIKNGKKL
jgi:hypothetical protein